MANKKDTSRVTAPKPAPTRIADIEVKFSPLDFSGPETDEVQDFFDQDLLVLVQFLEDAQTAAASRMVWPADHAKAGKKIRQLDVLRYFVFIEARKQIPALTLEDACLGWAELFEAVPSLSAADGVDPKAGGAKPKKQRT